MTKINASGLSCPAPVLETKAAVENRRPQRIDVLVDNEPARQNVARYLESQGYRIRVEQAGDSHMVIGTGVRGAPEPKPAGTASATDGKKMMVMVAADRMGSGDDLLGAKLMVNFI